MKNTFKIRGLTCDACVKLATKRINRIHGISDLKINRIQGLINLTADRKLSLQEIQETLKDTEYKIESAID
ncbi:MAG: heavy metal-associated domain-containing protein [Candidatus Staskawiczbacteria bacterium]|jgi:copper chaperone CopZ